MNTERENTQIAEKMIRRMLSGSNGSVWNEAFRAKTIVNDFVKAEIDNNQFQALVVLAFRARDEFMTSNLVKLLNRGWYDHVPTSIVRLVGKKDAWPIIEMWRGRYWMLDLKQAA